MSTIVGGHLVDYWMLKKRRMRRLWEDGEKIRIVAQTQVPGVSVYAGFNDLYKHGRMAIECEG